VKRSHFIIAAGSALSVPVFAAPSSAAGAFICPPCGCAGDKLSFDAPGACPYCGMRLVSRAADEGLAHGRLPNGASSLQFPFELLANQIFLPIKVNGRGPFAFILDTGAPATVVAGEYTGDLGYDPSSSQIALELPHRIAAKVTAGTMPLALSQPLIGRPVYGIIGVDVIRGYVWRIDYAQRLITLYDRDRFAYTGTAPVLAFAGRFESEPQIDGQLALADKPAIPVRFSLDLGAGGTVVSAPLVEQYAMTQSVTRTLPMYGVTGSNPDVTLLARIAALRVGPWLVREPIVSLSQDKDGVFASKAIGVNLGGSVLRRFTVTLDYLQGRLILEPNSDFSKPFESDASGITFTAAGPNFRTFVVQHVAAASPASVIGLRQGDVIAALDGDSAEHYAAWELEEALKQSGRRYRLTIKRGTRTLTRTLQLQSLL